MVSSTERHRGQGTLAHGGPRHPVGPVPAVVLGGDEGAGGGGRLLRDLRARACGRQRRTSEQAKGVVAPGRCRRARDGSSSGAIRQGGPQLPWEAASRHQRTWKHRRLKQAGGAGVGCRLQDTCGRSRREAANKQARPRCATRQAVRSRTPELGCSPGGADPAAGGLDGNPSDMLQHYAGA